MTLDDYLKISQILFYFIMALVASMTYVKAKNTLLNSVNTEYHKHVINALINLSNSLFSEFEEGNENHWTKESQIKEIVEEINRTFIEHKNEIISSGEFYGGIRISKLELRLSALIRQYKSDPFLPNEIRSKVIDLLQNRLDVNFSTTIGELEAYQEGLIQGKYQNNLEMNYAWISNNINSQLYQMGCGVSQIEEAVHEIRLEIKSYLEKFNPLKNA